MKRLLILTLLSIPALASAQTGPDSEAWTTFCDNGVEKVRSAYVVKIYNAGPIALSDSWGSEVYAGGFGVCDGSDDYCAGPNYQATIASLGGDLYEYSFTYPRECFADEAVRYGRLFYTVMIDDYPEGRYTILECSDGPQPIIDTVECSPLPVASSTWGAVKALYRVGQP